MLEFKNFCFDVPGKGEHEMNGVIQNGQVLVLRGASGSGKSTLLKAIAGLWASRGTLLLNGVDISSFDPKDRRAGVVFQGGALFPGKSVEENLNFPLLNFDPFRAWSDDLRKKRISEFLGAADLEGFGAREVSELSGGERQRVALLRAIIFDPEFLLLDEPLSALDPNLRKQMQEHIAYELKRFPRPVILVTHDDSEASAFASKSLTWSKSLFIE